MKYILMAIFLLFTGAQPFQSAGAQELELHGFAETAYGSRVEDNDVMGDQENTLGESRVQLQLQHFSDSADMYASVDFLHDAVDGGGFAMNIREAYMKLRAGSHADLKIGRQVITWGTGDMVFINDIFPKDYISFFTGRDDEYLKYPSDAVMVKFFTDVANIDVVGIPYFDPNVMPSGLRLSSFNPMTGGLAGGTVSAMPAEPSGSLDKGEAAVRVYRYLGSFQVAGYAHRGYYKSPMGMDMTSGTMYYPELSTYGASLRGPVNSGVLSVEYGYYDSREDSDGDDPLVPNSQHRYLVGYEREVWSDFTAGAQYYGEFMTDHDAYAGSLPPGAPEQDELRQLVTFRLTQQLMYQTVRLSLFTFYSPTDEDWHLRPNVNYKYSDELSITVGGNFFGGNEVSTMFGQFEGNDNLFARFRYSF